MRKQWLCGGIGLGSLLIVLAGISPVVGESDKSGGNERPVMEAMETPSFGTEDWVGPVETASFGAEDWVVASSISRSFGTEDWVPSDALATGTLPAPAR